MKMSHGIGHEPSLQRLVIASVVLHFILMAFLFIPFKTGEREFKTYYVSLAEPAKVSGGGETATRKAEAKPAVKKEVPSKEKKTVEKKAVPEKKDQMSLKKEKTSKSDETVAKKIKDIKDRKDIDASINAIKDKMRAIDIVRSEASAKGAGGSLGKGEQMASDSDCPYCTLITDRIRNEWIYPDFDSAGLEVIISIKIDNKGKVVSKTIEKSSGNILFDQSALKAISKASPLDLPPLLLVMEEIVLRFYP